MCINLLHTIIIAPQVAIAKIIHNYELKICDGYQACDPNHWHSSYSKSQKRDLVSTYCGHVVDD